MKPGRLMPFQTGAGASMQEKMLPCKKKPKTKMVAPVGRAGKGKNRRKWLFMIYDADVLKIYGDKRTGPKIKKGSEGSCTYQYPLSALRPSISSLAQLYFPIVFKCSRMSLL